MTVNKYTTIQDFNVVNKNIKISLTDFYNFII